MTDWQRVTHIRVSEDDEITADARVDDPSPWFPGHFPGEPILPGIAQLSMVCRAIETARGRPFKVLGVRRVRFKQVIRPGDALRVEVKPLLENKNAYAFRILIGAEVACTGNLMVEEA
jgi:3-hydroxymyristoyl/3-hydroxydecanoyl-(acyl carrier protein) dehydratase